MRLITAQPLAQSNGYACCQHSCAIGSMPNVHMIPSHYYEVACSESSMAKRGNERLVSTVFIQQCMPHHPSLTASADMTTSVMLLCNRSPHHLTDPCQNWCTLRPT